MAGMAYPDGPPVTSGNRTLMIAAMPLGFYDQSGALPPVAQGAAFWYRSDRAGELVADGQATCAPAGTPLPRWEPSNTVHGVPGFAAGTSNASP
jgi:hypothetical protein